MRNSFSGLFLVALMFAPHLPAAAAAIPSISGTTIPSVPQIVDSHLNVWTLSGGQAFENGKLTPSGGVILLLSYGGIVYQENIHHSWWLWGYWDAAPDDPTGVVKSGWVASSDPRVISPSGTTIPSATQIVDSGLNVWTLSGGKIYEKGRLTPSGGVILLLYANNIVYQENIHHDWWRWSDGVWEATSAPPVPSASGTTIPTTTRIVDDDLTIWTVSGGKVYENGALTPSAEVILLLFYSGNVYQENIHHGWWRWSDGAWVATPVDPRVAPPLAYVGTANNTVSIIDTGTNRVIDVVPVGFPPSHIAVTPDAKHVYVAGAGKLDATGSVAVIESVHKSVVTTIPVPYEPRGIVVSPDGKRVYVASGFADSVEPYLSVISTATNVVVATIDINGLNPKGIAISPDGKRIYVPLLGGLASDGFIAVIDTTTYSEMFIAFPNAQAELFSSAAVSPDNTKLYTTAYDYPPGGNSIIAVFNPVTGGLTKSIFAVISPEVFSLDSRHVYGVGLGGLGVINAATYAVTTAVANLPGATDLAITPDGRRFYITDSSTNSVVVADTSTYTISTVIGGVSAAGPIAIVPAH